MTCEIINAMPLWYLAIIFTLIHGFAGYIIYRHAYSTGRWDQRGDDLEQFVETGRLEYGWRKI